MGHYIKGTGKEIKLCSWRCVHCNQINTGRAFISVTAEQSYGLIGTTKSKAEENVKSFVRDELSKKMKTVNEKRIIPEGVAIGGKCASCGKVQPWASANKYPFLRLIAGILLGILAAVLISPYVSKIDSGDIYSFFLLFLTVVLVAWAVDKGSAKIIQIVIAKKMAAYGDDYFPKLSNPSEN